VTDYPAKLDVDFTADAAAVNTAIQALTIGDGGDVPETMFSALHMAYGLTWRPGVKKITVVLSDAPPWSPEPVSNLTVDDILNESLAIDPVEFHLVDVGGSRTVDLERLAAGTNGGVYSTADSEAADQIAAVIDKSLGQPYAWVQGPYVGKVGMTRTLDASGSYGVEANLVSYEWDFDGDDTFDATTATPTVTHTFDRELDGLLKVRVTDDRGRTGLTTTPLRVTDDGDEVARDADNCPDTANPGQEDEDRDGLGDACDPTTGFPTEDKPGVYEGTLAVSPAPAPAPPSAPAPAPPAATPTPAKADVKLGKVKVLARGKRMSVRVTCTAPKGTCTGRIAAKVGKRTFRGTYAVKAGRTATVTLKVPAKVRAALAKKRQTVTFTATTKAGATSTRSVKLARLKLKG
jgi:hypothetical protein